MAGVLTWFVLGAVGWTLAEQLLHDRAGHRAKGRTDFSREHLRHHAEREYFTPTAKKVRTAGPVLGAASAAAAAFAGSGGIAFVVGFGTMYAFYEWLHRRLHTHPPVGPVGRALRRHHFFHHFGDPRRNHGVTSAFWDLVFRQYAAPGRIRVPEARAMRWLVDPTTGEVWDAYRDDYQLVCRRGAPDAVEA
jgi:sterol desaturase/sphingolipid hydroxylase (fatty acid hydroxylase superfamily)